MDETIDLSPRKVWTGATIPGKRMVEALNNTAITAGEDLVAYYAGPLDQMIAILAFVLHAAPSEAPRIGPTVRNLRPGAGSDMLGALLTDIRDFTKLRFRCEGLSAYASAPSGLQPGFGRHEVERVLKNYDSREAALPILSYIVNYIVTALDNLSKGVSIPTEVATETRRLRDILIGMIRWAVLNRWDYPPYSEAGLSKSQLAEAKRQDLIGIEEQMKQTLAIMEMDNTTGAGG